MAISRNNPFTLGLSGMIGGTVVFRQYNGKTIVSNRPRVPARWSEKQKATRENFKEATMFANAMMLVPEKKFYYTKKAAKMGLPNAYTAAVTDYLRKPVIEDVKVASDKKSVWARVHKKGFGVGKVELYVINDLGHTIERGMMQPRGDGKWMYVLKGELIQNARFRLIQDTRFGLIQDTRFKIQNENSGEVS